MYLKKINRSLLLLFLIQYSRCVYAGTVLAGNNETNIANGVNTVIVGGTDNQLGGFNNFIGAGSSNNVSMISEDSCIVAGESNSVGGTKSVIAGGSHNSISASFAGEMRF